MKNLNLVTFMSVLALSSTCAYAREAAFEEMLGGDSGSIIQALNAAAVPDARAINVAVQDPAAKAQPAAANAVLEIVSQENISLRATGTYQATAHGFGCFQTSFSDGHMESLPKVFDQELPVAASPNGGVVTVATKLSNCQSALRGLTLRVSGPKIDRDFNAIGLEFSDVNQDAVQRIVFKKIQSPWTGVSWTTSGKSILVGPNGKAKAEILLE